MMRIVGVSGHRPSKAGYDQVKLVMFAQLVLIQQDPTRVLTGMAVGWDQAVAEACVQLRIPFVAVIPFAGQESRWPASVQKRYFELLELAHSAVVVSRGEYSPTKMKARNRYLADHSTKAVVLYDGFGDSGTAQFVRHAENIGLPYLNVWDDWQLYQRELPETVR